MASLWQDPRTGIYKLRKRIPTRYRTVCGRTGDTLKISTGTADRKAAEKELPRVLAEWAALEADWERQMHIVAVTPDLAREMAATWAAWITADYGRLDVGEDDRRRLSDDPVTSRLKIVAGRLGWPAHQPAKELELISRVADQAAALSSLTVSEETREVLYEAMRPVVEAAAREASIRRDGGTGTGQRWSPLQEVRKDMPQARVVEPPPNPSVSLVALYDTWKAVAVSKPRTIHDTRYVVDQLASFLGHNDAATITREDIRRWRDATKAEGVTNNTWNNRFSMLRQVFAQAVRDGVLSENPADNTLRLPKSKAAERHPYTDDEARRILTAARQATVPTRRWAHWIMAFTGMRVAEVLQLTKEDLKRDREVWFFDVNEDEPGKSVKTGQRRHVPIHPALIEEGLIRYVEELPKGGPLFPDKGLDAFGRRGGRGWNVVGVWVRETVGITEKNKAPNHSWRHRIEDEMRAAEVPEDVRDAITGRTRKTTGRLYGIRGEALSRLQRHLARVHVPPGL